MLKYANTQVTFAEIPDEISLCINISNCPIRCNKCHSRYLWEDIGDPLTTEALDRLILQNNGITCVCFMGGDIAPHEINWLAKHVRTHYPHLKTGWYSGLETVSLFTECENFNYIKVGPYVKKLGGLDSPVTNQRLYEVNGRALKNITSRFWKKSGAYKNNN